MLNIKNGGKTIKRDPDMIIRRQVHQLHIDLKRGLLPYVILFFLKIRPHYSLEIFKKMSHIDDGMFNIRQNIIYQNLKKFEQKGIVASYREKSNFGPKRKYYYLTKLGERLFEEIVIKQLDPLMFMFSTIMVNMNIGFGVKRKISPKKLNRIQMHLKKEINSNSNCE
jgi:DNA-binding PadR family transcriptional regulator